MKAYHHLYTMNTCEVKALSERTRMAFLPVGPTEVHSLHLPTSTDIVRAIGMSELTAEKLFYEDGMESLIAPAINYMPSDCSNVFPGSTSIRRETAIAITYDVCVSLIRWGFDRIAIMCGHHDPSCMDSLEQAAADAMKDFPQAKIIVAKWSPLADVNPVLHCEHPQWDMHAGEIETSVMMIHDPEHVDIDRMKTLEPNWEGQYLFERLAQGMNFIEMGADKCYFGDPASGKPETGRKILQIQRDYAYEEVKKMF